MFLALCRCGKVNIIEAIYNEHECFECKIHVFHLSQNRIKAVDETDGYIYFSFYERLNIDISLVMIIEK